MGVFNMGGWDTYFLPLVHNDHTHGKISFINKYVYIYIYMYINMYIRNPQKVTEKQK